MSSKRLPVSDHPDSDNPPTGLYGYPSSPVVGRLVIPARSPVEGVLTEVRNKGMWGKSGGVKLKISSVNINGANIRLTGDMDDRGETGTAGVVGAVIAFPLAGFFVTGTNAEMPLGMPGRAFAARQLA